MWANADAEHARLYCTSLGKSRWYRSGPVPATPLIPGQEARGECDAGLALPRIVQWQRSVLDLDAARTRENMAREFDHGEIDRIADVDRPPYRIIGRHQAEARRSAIARTERSLTSPRRSPESTCAATASEAVALSDSFQVDLQR